MPDLATDLVRHQVNVIVTSVNTDTLAAKNATKTIPIVMASAGDPVGGGLVKSLARPGGNITGLSQIAPDLAGKRLQVLKEIAPGSPAQRCCGIHTALRHQLLGEKFSFPRRSFPSNFSRCR